MYKFLKYDKRPDFIASRKPFLVDGKRTGWIEEEWYTGDIAVPLWWNEECHRMVEGRSLFGLKGLMKFCLRCNKELPENGCIHNIDKK